MIRETPFEKWYDDLHAICGAYDGVPQRGQRAVKGRIGVHAFDHLDVADVWGDVAKIERDRAGIRRDDNEYIFFVIEMSGTLAVDHNETQSRLAPGDAVLLDSTKEGVLHLAENSSRLMSVHLPRQSFLSERRPGVHIGRKLAATTPVARTLTRHFFRFFNENGAGERQGNASLLYDMIHLAFSRPEDGLAGITLSDAASRYDLALDLIDTHLTADYLSLPWLAGQLGVSERQLQRLFHAHETSFIDLVRSKRYRFVTEHLNHLPHVHGRISDIAYRAGFQDLSNFNRGFRARFGMSPRDYHRGRRTAPPHMA
ncbi:MULTISPECIES: helix-turn-helix domain-containing protein [Paracoccaceae]|jgi:AraC-like DNA-binding protein|uniref:helix-turn-helix domain-containing protein n=1 Tax=Rhodobacterales TaxID=204455 RepID=UPI001D09B032|nr:helix-turn-helix domain-containing protein [Boseongicola sp. H5]